MEDEKKKDIKPIDFTDIVKKLWPHRKTYCYVLPATLVLTYLLMVCIPRYYSCTVSLAPEAGGASISGSLGSLASSFGLGGSLAKLNSEDAISSDIYPDVIGSKKFISELMVVDIKTKEGDVKCNYYTYLRDHQDDAWWNKLRGALSEAIKPTPKDAYNGKEKISVFNLTKQQDDIFNSVQGKIKCVVDKKTGVVTITMKDQDPLVCATMADATLKKLQEFIIAYRTNKARIDYEYYKKLCEESQQAYEKSVKAYAATADANRNAVLVSYTTKETTLENEMQSNFTVYTAMKAQMQGAAAKLQEATPAFTVIESASVPNKPAGPKRTLIALIVTVLAFVVLSIKYIVSDK